jgi:hypothetical protein
MPLRGAAERDGDGKAAAKPVPPAEPAAASEPAGA